MIVTNSEMRTVIPYISIAAVMLKAEFSNTGLIAEHKMQKTTDNRFNVKFKYKKIVEKMFNIEFNQIQNILRLG